VALESVSIDAGTEKPIATDSIGGTLDVQVMKLNLGADGVVGDNWDGKLQGGTVNVGTVNVSGGSIAVTAGTTVITSGTITNSGTTTGVGSVSAIAQLHNAGTVQTILAGTVTNVGTVVGVGVVTAVTNGTIATNILPLGVVLVNTAIAVGSAGTAMPIPTSALSGRKSLICYNSGTATIYIGGGTVTTATGIPITESSYSPSFDIGTTILYGVVPADAVGGTIIAMEVS